MNFRFRTAVVFTEAFTKVLSRAGQCNRHLEANFENRIGLDHVMQEAIRGCVTLTACQAVGTKKLPCSRQNNDAQAMLFFE